jgi:hypothetical protein
MHTQRNWWRKLVLTFVRDSWSHGFKPSLDGSVGSTTFQPGANPTTSIYNASIVNFYNATGNKARFENKNILFYFEKRSSLLQRWRCSCKFKSRRIGS